MPSTLRTAMLCLSCAMWCPVAVAQQVVAQGEIIRPEFSTFTAGTSVSVPDRGSMYLGGLDSAREARTEFGPGLRNHGIGRNTAAQNSGVRVFIFDPAEWEEALALDAAGVAERRRPLTPGERAIDRYASASTPGREISPAAPPPASPGPSRESLVSFRPARELVTRARQLQADGKFVEAARAWELARTQHAAEIDRSEAARELMALRRRSDVAAALDEPKAATLLAQARDAERTGKPTVARVLYQSAARLTPAPSADAAATRLSELRTQLAVAPRAKS